MIWYIDATEGINFWRMIWLAIWNFRNLARTCRISHIANCQTDRQNPSTVRPRPGCTKTESLIVGSSRSEPVNMITYDDRWNYSLTEASAEVFYSGFFRGEPCQRSCFRRSFRRVEVKGTVSSCILGTPTLLVLLLLTWVLKDLRLRTPARTLNFVDMSASSSQTEKAFE